MKLLVLDGNSILNRSFYGIKLLSTKEGIYTNAVYGFLATFEKLKEETKPDAIAIAFDKKTPTFRHKLFGGYKAKRKGMPDELASQLPVLKELLLLLGYKLVECEGFEADDILGTLADSCIKNNDNCIIATGDKDSLQLINDNVTVRIASTKMGKPQIVIYNKEKILTDFHVNPSQLIDVKALQGDASDNIPGVSGVGPKTAVKLIEKFHDIDNIYKNIENIDIKAGTRKKLIEDKDNAYLSRTLGEIRKDVPIDTNIKSYIKGKQNSEKALKLMTKLEFFSLIDKMNLKVESEFNKDDLKEVSVNFNVDLNILKNKIIKYNKAQFVINWHEQNIKNIAFIIKKEIFIISGTDDSVDDFLKSIFEDENIEKITHAFKRLFSHVKTKNIKIKNALFDTMLAGYLLNPSSSVYELTRMFKEYNVFYEYDFNKDEEYNKLINEAFNLPKLVKIIYDKIFKNNQLNLLQNIEIPFSGVLADMESIGFKVDLQAIKTYGMDLQKKIDKLKLKIFEYVGYEINLNSPKQLGHVLFETLGLLTKKKTKTGYSTSADVLESLRYEHPVVELILEYRTFSKLKSTYCDGMLKVINNDGRIHSKFNQTETKTGRISSTEPNLQNIPVRTQVGKELRRFFVAEKGCLLVDADYSQIELRILAHISKDELMINAFKNNEDIHSITASQVFNMPINMLTPVMRTRAKAVNFGIIYGIGAFSLSKDLKVPVKIADKYIKDYLMNYSGVNKYMQEIVNSAKEKGYVETMFSRRRYLPELNSSNYNLRSFGERVARNMPIQGTAADIIKIAMIRVTQKFREEKMKSRLILQVHDELIVESPKEEAEHAAYLLKNEMESAVKLDVPLIADTSICKNWYGAKA